MKKIKFDFTKKIGMRNLKTAIAVTIGLYLSEILHLNTPIFTSIACITGMKGSFAESFKDFRLRMFTAIFGVVLGFLLGLIPVSDMVSPIIAGLGIIFIIYILVGLGQKDKVILSCIVYVASFVYPDSRLIYGVTRIVGTFLGLLVALVVNFVLSSPDVNEDFNTLSISLYEKSRTLLLDLIYSHKNSVEAFEKSFDAVSEKYKLLQDELNTPIHPNIDINTDFQIMKLFEDLHLRFLLLQSINEIPKLKPSVLELLEDEFQTSLVINGTLEGDLNDIYNLHIKKILFNFEALRKLLKIDEN